MVPFKIFRGVDSNINIQFLTEDNEFMDLTGVTTLEVYFKNADKTDLIKTLLDDVSVVNAVSGKILVSLSEAETALLLSGNKKSFYAIIDISGDTNAVQFDGVMNVLDLVSG